MREIDAIAKALHISGAPAERLMSLTKDRKNTRNQMDPLLNPMGFELIVNLKVAKALTLA